MTADTLTLAEFLRARFDEDEARAESEDATTYGAGWLVDRVLADLEAKRRILAEHSYPDVEPLVTEWIGGRQIIDCPTCDGQHVPCRTLRILASVYADHPDYLEEWRP